MWKTWLMLCVICAVSTTVLAADKHKRKAPAGPRETLACRLGTEDRHARIAVVVVGGKTQEFAYYSKWKPRTCSIAFQRNDAYSKWADAGNITTVDLEKGAMLIEHKKGEYHFVFREIDRERFCGMDGRINGSLTIRKGREACELEGIMDEGTPLGQAFAGLDIPAEQGTVAAMLQPKSAAPTAAAAQAGAAQPSGATEQTAQAPGDGSSAECGASTGNAC